MTQLFHIIAGRVRACAARVDAWFHDRQIIIRGHDRLTTVHITRKHQLVVAWSGAGVVLWSLLTPLIVMGALRVSAHTTVAVLRLRHELADTRSHLQAVAAQNSALANAAAAAQAQTLAAQAQVSAAKAQTSAVASASNQHIQALDAQTQAAIAQVQSILHQAGIKPARLPASADHSDLLQGDLAHLQSLSTLLGHVPLSQPVNSMVISSPFGMRPDPWTGVPEFHVGIDLPGPIGTPIHATAPGVVVFAGTSTGYGLLVILDHGYGLTTRYSHLDRILVRVGQSVALHQTVGLMGNTGWSTGPHLLYETRIDGAPANPLNFLKVRDDDLQD